MRLAFAPAHALRTAVLLTTATALAACAERLTAPAAGPSPAFAYLPPPEVSGGVDSTVVDPTPVPLQGGTASIAVTVYTAGTPDGTLVTFNCEGRTATGSVRGGVATAVCPVTTPGVYPVTATVGGGTPVPAPSYGVVFDPAGGFVTGGGWINAPAGAYAANPGLVTRASFGFVAKYLPGRQTPDGETEFQFRAANFNFHGGTYEWLVVSGARAQYRGTGTVNNAGRYDFVVTAIDGHRLGNGAPDQFRIAITDRATGAVVYDNQRGAEEIGDAATALASGSISIKK